MLVMEVEMSIRIGSPGRRQPGGDRVGRHDGGGASVRHDSRDERIRTLHDRHQPALGRPHDIDGEAGDVMGASYDDGAGCRRFAAIAAAVSRGAQREPLPGQGGRHPRFSLAGREFTIFGAPALAMAPFSTSPR